jgi:hypothetical protein
MATQKRLRNISCDTEIQLNQQFEHSLSLLRAASVKAVETLLSHATDKNIPPQVRVHAAQILLDKAVELHKLSELEEKLQQLEAMINTRTIK